ncbi:hypothetical protein JG687_00002837 [Phytophthora cactorum]|uniref:Uncharacterized protein n=1 Tax=Phytophthora cactorum TaxID=29920 RepID=A0A8T1UTA3_9STRA|nr:hypothetical protein JG687_00002837 [Phytophthora cactorum]
MADDQEDNDMEQGFPYSRRMASPQPRPGRPKHVIWSYFEKVADGSPKPRLSATIAERSFAALSRGRTCNDILRSFQMLLSLSSIEYSATFAVLNVIRRLQGFERPC